MTMYDEIVKKYYGIIYNYCRQRLNFSKTAAEDVTQEVFFILYKKLNRLKMSEKIGIWLFRTADNEIKAYIRKNPSYIPMENCPEETLMTDSTFPSLEDSDFDCLTDEEMSKPVKKRDYEKIASLSADLCALIDGEPETNEIDNGINKLYNRISEYEKNRRKPSVRVVRKMIPVVCVAAVMLAANCFTVSAFGKNVFSIVIEFAQGGFSIDFNKQNDVIELPTSEDDPYGIIAECAKYEIYPETPHYLPDGFELTLMTNDVNEHSNYAKFVFRNEDKVIALTYTRY